MMMMPRFVGFLPIKSTNLVSSEGALYVMEESGGDPGRERGGEALLLRKMIEFSNWGQFVGGGFF